MNISGLMKPCICTTSFIFVNAGVTCCNFFSAHGTVHSPRYRACAHGELSRSLGKNERTCAGCFVPVL